MKNWFTYTKIFLLAIVFSVAFSKQGFSQITNNETTDNEQIAMTNSSNSKKPWIGNNAFLYEYLRKIGYSDNNNKVFFRVPVRFWVYSRSSQQILVSEAFLREQINNLNHYYALNNVGIQFYMYPKVTYVNNKRLYILKYMTSGFIQALKTNSKGTINILFTKNIVKKVFGQKVKEYNGVHNAISGAILIRNKNLPTQTLSHEVGHYFGLDHLHNDYHKGKLKQEAVSRTRKHPGLFKSGAICEYNGDGLCDTPAEPKLSNYTDEKCNYIGGVKKDKWGDLYKPSTNNIMSYTSNRECRNHFTKGQIAIMLYTAQHSKYAKYWQASKHVENSFDAQEPNKSKEMAAELKVNAPYENTFHLVKKYDSNYLYYDKNDWFKFTLKNSFYNNAKIILERHSKFAFPKEIKISIYDKNNKLIKQQTVNKANTEIKLGNLRGTYFIDVSNSNPKDYITGYKITVRNL